MKLAVLIILAAASHAAKVGAKNKKIEEKTDKRELSEGNAGLEKRAPILPTASSTLTGGVQYAETNNALSDQSPTQQIYATPAPQFSKISDLLTGQVPSYQAAIASHLYSPVSLYQSRFGQPTTYEVSAPVPSNLAYTEHRLSLPSPNSIPYNTKPQKLVKPQYEQPQGLIQQSYEQNLAPIQSTALNQQVQYNQIPQQFYNSQPLQYVQQPNQLPAATYHQEQLRNHQQPGPRDLKNQPAASQVLEKQVIQQVYNDKQQNALSFARFSVNQPTPAYDQNQLQQIHQQPLPQSQLQAQQVIQPQQQHYQQLVQPQQYQQPQQLIQPQQQQYQLQAQPLQISYQLQHPTPQQLPQIQYQGQHQASQQPLQQQIQYQPQQHQIQYQEQPQYVYQQLQEQALQQQALSYPQQVQDQSQAQYQIQDQPYQQPNCLMSKNLNRSYRSNLSLRDKVYSNKRRIFNPS
ncbi:LOW QUALITY PROTEIN: putative mediator of RNA polymerase II transcription subunit 26 [Pararge aegeria]|uniref:LOW QUALITY PROTEIN: putative mediator of RNA polymerase II transcription subunit 26 n=1 Tax=Pararge aegeria TaxID=116150 RepID=UPI0019D0C198|nr:LOW QUALITY PROTEIN: putative mediator of RNA polymerase II transcription subunit 26 [Pararge aegeria]